MEENNVAILDRRTLIGIAAAGLAASLASCAARPQTSGASASSGELRRRFVGKVVVITGATSGIGRAAAFQFAADVMLGNFADNF